MHRLCLLAAMAAVQLKSDTVLHPVLCSTMHRLCRLAAMAAMRFVLLYSNKRRVL